MFHGKFIFLRGLLFIKQYLICLNQKLYPGQFLYHVGGESQVSNLGPLLLNGKVLEYF